MFATKGRLKVSLLVVGVLIVGLGMYGAFQPKQAQAHCSTTGLVHDYYDWKIGRTQTTLDSWNETTNCSRCPGYPASKHKKKEVEFKKKGRWIYKHRWFWSSNWDHCHSHGYSTSYTLVQTEVCNKSGGGDN